MNRLRDLRNEKNLTLMDLSKKLNMAYSNIAMIERGERNYTSENLKIFSEFFDVSSDYLLGLSDIRNQRVEQDEIQQDDQELFLNFKELMRREECALLFSKAKELDASTIKKMLNIIKIIEDENK